MPRLRKRLLTGMFALSFIAVGYHGFQLAAQLLFNNVKIIETSLITPSDNSIMQTSQVTLKDYKSLQDSTWFGISTALQESKMAVETVTATSLNVTLKGTIMGGSPRAIIKDNESGRSHVLRLGEEFLSGVKLQQVQRRKVVLNNNGKLEALALPGELHEDENMQIAVTTPQATASQVPALIAQKSVQTTSKPRVFKRSKPKYIPLAQRKVNKRQSISISRMVIVKALANIGELATQARFVPRIANGKLVGFKLVNLKHDSLLSKLSVREGDILVRVDEIPVSQRDKLFPMLMGLAKANKAELVISRGGELISIMVKIG